MWGAVCGVVGGGGVDSRWVGGTLEFEVVARRRCVNAIDFRGQLSYHVSRRLCTLSPSFYFYITRLKRDSQVDICMYGFPSLYQHINLRVELNHV